MAKNYSNANNSDKNAQSKNGAFIFLFRVNRTAAKNCDKEHNEKMQAEMQVKTQTKMQIKTAQSLL